MSRLLVGLSCGSPLAAMSRLCKRLCYLCGIVTFLLGMGTTVFVLLPHEVSLSVQSGSGSDVQERSIPEVTKASSQGWSAGLGASVCFRGQHRAGEMLASCSLGGGTGLGRALTVLTPASSSQVGTHAALYTLQAPLRPCVRCLLHLFWTDRLCRHRG